MKEMQACPLLHDPAAYDPDTKAIQTTHDDKKYWLEFCVSIVRTAASKAAALNPGVADAQAKAEECLKKYEEYVKGLLSGSEGGTVRLALEKAEDLLKQHGFEDLWFAQKEKETEVAVRALRGRLDLVDALEDFEERWCELAKGLAAGNVFDWGVQEIQGIVQEVNLQRAIEAMQMPPSFQDGLDAFIKRLKVTRKW